MPPGSTSFVDLLGPPMELGGRADALALLLEGSAVRELGLLQLLDAGEMLVDQRRVSQRPQVLGGLQLRRVGWQEEQTDVVGHPQAHAGVPTRPIQHKDDLLGGAGPYLSGEHSQFHLEH